MGPSHCRTPLVVLLWAGLLTLHGCGGPRGRVPAPTPPGSGIRLTRRTAEAGIRFHHEDGSSGRKYFPEVMGPGCAFVDLTGDGLPDIYLINGAPLPGAPTGAVYGNRFYRNNGDGTFTDGTTKAGLADGRYGMGCCAGDYDNDGFVDLYVTHLGRNTLFRSNGDGTFTDVTAAARVGGGGFSTGAAFADYDNDGYLDLYACRYVDWAPERNVACTAKDGTTTVRVYCRPDVYPPVRDILYRNNGNGTFTDVTRAVGMDVEPGRGLGCVWCDVDNDGDQELFVANDTTANLLFINNGSGRFSEEALARGVAFGENGRPQASMGVAAVDYDGDGRLDLGCTNFSGEYLTIYRNLGAGRFEDASARAGVMEATSRYVGFGLGFPDLNLDGWSDLFVGNGHVTEAAERFYPGASFAQPSLCLLNNGSGGFAPAPDPGPGVTSPRVSRGVAFGDYDGDGGPDVLVNNWRGEPDLLRNDVRDRGHWLRLTLVGSKCNRSAIGARVEVTSGGRTQVQEVRSGGSYCSQSEFALTFGLGVSLVAEMVRIHWPGGGTDTWDRLPAGRAHTLRQQTRNAKTAESETSVTKRPVRKLAGSKRISTR